MHTGWHPVQGSTAYTAGIEHGCRATWPSGTLVTWGGRKHTLPFEEKCALFRKEGFVGCKVHHDIIGLNVTKVRIQTGRKLRIGCWTPEDFRAGPHVVIVTYCIMGGRHIRIKRQLRARFNILKFKFLES